MYMYKTTYSHAVSIHKVIVFSCNYLDVKFSDSKYCIDDNSSIVKPVLLLSNQLCTSVTVSIIIECNNSKSCMYVIVYLHRCIHNYVMHTYVCMLYHGQERLK